MTAERWPLFGIEIDALRLQTAAAQVLAWCSQPGVGCRYVVTPNVDHLVLLKSHSGLQRAYREASLVLADGAPVVWAARLLGWPLPERVAGSDLVPAVFAAAQAANRPLRVFLLGAAPGVAERAAEWIHARWPCAQVVGCASPPLGFEHSAAENARLIAQVNAAGTELLLLGLGAPKQELWIAERRAQLHARAVLCAGATIDFLAGARRRAPRWLQRLGLEWLHRMLSEPRRLVRRYARDAWEFPGVVLRQWRAQVALQHAAERLTNGT